MQGTLKLLLDDAWCFGNQSSSPAQSATITEHIKIVCVAHGSRLTPFLNHI